MPTTEPPGCPISTGMRRLSDEEQAEARRQHYELIERIRPFLIEADRCRNRAAAMARTAVIG